MKAKIIQSCNYFSTDKEHDLVKYIFDAVQVDATLEDYVIEEMVNEFIQLNCDIHSKLSKKRIEVLYGKTDETKFIRIVKKTVDDWKLIVLMTIIFVSEPTP